MSEANLYVVESYLFEVRHNGRTSHGVLGEHRGGEKLYLHVLPLSEADIGRLATRLDEHGNRQSERFALPRNEDFWVALEGEVLWPKLGRSRIRSTARIAGKRIVPTPLTPDDLATLRAAGVAG